VSGPAYSNGDGPHGGDGSGEGLPRVPHQRDQRHQAGGARPLPAPEPFAGPEPEPEPDRSRPPLYDHGTLKSLLGAWALAVCSRDESLAVEVHLTDCAACAEEALRLRNAVGLLHHEESLDLDPLLRARVLEACLGRRPARIPVPEWAAPYDTEAARLDALLRDLGDSYWREPVELRWYENGLQARRATVADVIAHLSTVDGLVAAALGAPAPDAEGLPLDPALRTEAVWAAGRAAAEAGTAPAGGELRDVWREQSHHLLRTVSFAGDGAAGVEVGFGARRLSLRDAFVDRAFECWMHAADIAEAVDYPYAPPAPRHLHRMVGLAAKMLPGALAERRRAGLADSPARLADAGVPGRSLQLDIEGAGAGRWLLPLDSPGAVASPDQVVAQVAMDSEEFCQLAAGRLEPERAVRGELGDRAVVRDVLFAAASLSRL
jgi:hypothetical protein